MRRLLLASASLAAAAAGGPAARAQDGAGQVISAQITQSLVADTNYDLDDPSPGTSYYADTRLILGFLTSTPTQTFALGLDTGLRALWQADEDFDLTFASPSTATLDYGNEWSSGSADAFLSYRQTDVDSTTFELDGGPGTDDLTELQNDVTERRWDAGFGLEFATDAPSSYALNFAATNFDYTGGNADDTGDDETPRTTLVGDATWLLRFTPVLTGTLTGAYDYYTADNDEETEIRQSEIVLGAIYTPSPVLALRGGVGYGTYERQQDDDQGVRQTLDDDKGYVLTAGLDYDFDDVTVGADLRLSDAAPETRLSGAIRAVYPLPSGAVTGRIFQRYGGGDTGEEIRVTGASIGLLHEINTVSSLNFDLNVAKQQNFDTDEADIERLNFEAAYSYALTDRVSANVGYRYRIRNQDPENADSNAVFVEIGRAFQTTP